jgi:hypothetical protein
MRELFASVAASRTDDEVMEIFNYHESLSREAFGQVLDMRATKGPLRPDTTRDRLLDVFLVVYGDATYHQLTTQMGWFHEAAMDWLCEYLSPMLLESFCLRSLFEGRAASACMPGRTCW